MVPSQQEEILGMLDLVGQQQADALNRLFSSINIVAQEEVVGIAWETSIFKEFDKVGELAMDITTDFDGGFEFE